MRAPIALAIYASVLAGISAAGCFAGGPADVKINLPDNIVSDTPGSDSAASQWLAGYKAGLAASDRHRDEEALHLFERSWQTASTSIQRGASEDGLGQM